MLRLTDIKLPLDHEEAALRAAVVDKLQINDADILKLNMFKRSYDARRKSEIVLIYTLDIETPREAELLETFSVDQKVKRTPNLDYSYVAQAPAKEIARPIVIGMGPCGLFAGLILAQMGFKPIILERGKEVRERTKDTFGLWRKRQLNPESNVQFGEGGAGTFSDGKLYTQIKDPMLRGRKVLTEFVKAGAPEEILFVSKPHIGTFKLVNMVEKMRANIIELGGEVRFSARVDKLNMAKDGDQNTVTGVTLSNGEVLESPYVVMALGHSARDTFEMLHAEGVHLEAKPFSIGLRIEHPQSMIDEVRFGESAGNPILGSADYKLVHHCKSGRSVYSFCMCPGGTVVASSSEPERVVTNGMSQYSRNELNANSAIVVGITPEDYPGGPLAGIELQRDLESRAYKLGGANYSAPAQMVGDFLRDKTSKSHAAVEPSYKPGVRMNDLSKVLPDYAVEAIKEALPEFDKKIKGFARKDALLTGVETRTSSPVCIKRDKACQSINTTGLYPAGEGAGYAGGILSAAVDGIKVAEALALQMLVDEEASA